MKYEMSLRDYFAAQAMSSFMRGYSPENMAKEAYCRADAMLEARNIDHTLPQKHTASGDRNS